VLLTLTLVGVAIALSALLTSRRVNQSAPVVPTRTAAPAPDLPAPAVTPPKPENATVTAPAPTPTTSERRPPGRTGSPKRASASGQTPTPSRVDERGLVKENPFAQ